MAATDLETGFPNLSREGYRITSEATLDYNCFAWAVSNTKRWWSPSPSRGYYWPADVAANAKVDSFITLYSKEGFVPCDDARREPGFEKLAIYCGADGEVTHVARQMRNGSWTSKLGDWEDIEHRSLSAIEGVFYGHVAQLLKRKITSG